MKKYELCIYTFDWETLETFNTLEEAQKYATELFKKQKMDLAIFYDDQLIDEYKP